MSQCDKNPGPFPIRKRGDKWDVLVIIEGEAKSDITCDTKDDAEAVANARKFHYEYLTKGRCDPNEVDRTVDALYRHQLGNSPLSHHLTHFADLLRGNTDHGDIHLRSAST
jgi:hypothetical protein